MNEDGVNQSTDLFDYVAGVIGWRGGGEGFYGFSYYDFLKIL